MDYNIELRFERCTAAALMNLVSYIQLGANSCRVPENTQCMAAQSWQSLTYENQDLTDTAAENIMI